MRNYKFKNSDLTLRGDEELIHSHASGVFKIFVGSLLILLLFLATFQPVGNGAQVTERGTEALAEADTSQQFHPTTQQLWRDGNAATQLAIAQSTGENTGYPVDLFYGGPRIYGGRPIYIADSDDLPGGSGRPGAYDPSGPRQLPGTASDESPNLDGSSFSSQPDKPTPQSWPTRPDAEDPRGPHQLPGSANGSSPNSGGSTLPSQDGTSEPQSWPIRPDAEDPRGPHHLPDISSGKGGSGAARVNEPVLAQKPYEIEPTKFGVLKEPVLPRQSHFLREVDLSTLQRANSELGHG